MMFSKLIEINNRRNPIKLNEEEYYPQLPKIHKRAEIRREIDEKQILRENRSLEKRLKEKKR